MVAPVVVVACALWVTWHLVLLWLGAHLDQMDLALGHIGGTRAPPSMGSIAATRVNRTIARRILHL